MEKVIKILFIILICIFPFGQIARIDLGGGLVLLLNDFVVCILAGAFGIRAIAARQRFHKNPLVKPLLVFTSFALFSLILNSLLFTTTQLVISSLYLVRFIAYTSLYFIVLQFTTKVKRRVLRGLVVVGMITAVVGLVQYFLYPDLRNLSYAGWDEHLYRLFSSFLDPNFAGGIFVLTFLLAVGKRDFLSLLACFFSFVGMLLTYSRGSFVSFAAGIFTLFSLTKRWKIFIGLCFALALGIILLPKDLKSEGVKLLRVASVRQRIESAGNAIMIVRDHPLFGIGFNTYRFAQLRYGFITKGEEADSHGVAGTDNSFLFVLATTGLIGLLSYAALWGTIVRQAWGNHVVVASITAIFIHSLFVNSLFYPHIMEWIWILIAAS